MRGALLALLVAMAACTSSLPPQPAPTPPAGPKIPAGAHPVDVMSWGPGPAGCGTAPSISAGLSRGEAEIPALEQCSAQCDTPGFACWAELPNQPGELYFVVLTANECNRPVQDVAAVGGSTFYFVHWIGKSLGVCNLAMALPAWRLYSVPTSVLPSSGTLTVELQIQTQDEGATNVDAYVNLG